MQKNFAVFIVACLAIIMGWLYLQQQLWPPRRPDQQIAKKDDKKDDKKVDKKDGDKKDNEKKVEPKKETKPPEVKPPDPKPEIKIKPAAPEPKPQTIALGGDDTHLQVVLTTRGAGVQQLTLNRFKASDYLGMPVDRNLELIQEDPHMPSFLMYHYGAVDAAHPLFGLGEKTWQLHGKGKVVSADGTEEVAFSLRVPERENIRIIKTYRLKPKDYHLTLVLEFERDKEGADAKDVKDELFRYQLTGAHGLPIEGEWYTSVYRKAILGMLDDRNTLIRDLDNEDSFRLSHMAGGKKFPESRNNNSMLLYAGVATQYFASVLVVDDKQEKVDRKSILAWARPTLESTELAGKFKGIVGDKIDFEQAKKKTDARKLYELLPHVKRHIDELELKDGDPALISYYELPDGQRVATWIRAGENLRPFLDDITARVNSEPISLQPGDKVAHQFLLYHGPVKTQLLRQFGDKGSVDSDLVDRYTETLHLRTLTDYRSQGPFGTFANSIGLTWLLIQTTKLMHLLLYWLSFLTFGNYGLSIMLLTVLVRGMMFPISKKQAMFSIRMQALAPELKKMSEKYKNDPQGKTQATMELYRKHNVHPLGGCLPLFLQLPIFLGLYYALQESISFRLAGFLWMDNLAAPDMLIWWTENIPFISHPDGQSGAAKGLFDVILGLFYLGPYLNLLPLCAVSLMVVQQRIMTPPPTDETQALNFKVMQYMMIFMGLVFYKVASGLCIYFIASSLWGLAERQLLPKKKVGEVVVAASSNGKASPSGKGKGKQATKPEDDGVVQKAKDWWTDLLEKARKK